jgi:hypothetical protein
MQRPLSYLQEDVEEDKEIVIAVKFRVAAVKGSNPRELPQPRYFGQSAYGVQTGSQFLWTKC